MSNQWLWKLAGRLLLLSAALCGCAINPVTGKNELMLVSEQEERQLGDQTKQAVIEEYGIYDNSSLQAYVNGVAKPLAKVSHRPGLDWQFQVMDSPVVNAFAAPGGYVFVTRGLLATVNDEAELAGILAHEIGHVTARHSARKYSQSMITGIGLQLGTALAGDYGKVLGPLLEAGTGLLFLKYSRDDERQADALGVEYAAKTGYDTNRMADFFATLQRQETLEGGTGGGLPEWFSTHPSPVDREASVRTQTAQWRTQLPKQEFQTNRETYLARIDGLIYGEDPRQGFRDGEWFCLPRYQAQFRIPAQWTYAREGNRIQMSHPEQKGVVLFSIQSGTVDQLSRDFVASMKANVQQSADRTINGLKAREIVSVVTDGQQKARVVSHFFQKGDEVLMFHGLADEAGFAQLAATLRQPAASFAPLTDKAKLNRQPQHLVVRQVSKAATLEVFLQEQQVDQALWPRIAWMNEMRLADRLLVGQRVKIVK